MSWPGGPNVRRLFSTLSRLVRVAPALLVATAGPVSAEEANRGVLAGFPKPAVEARLIARNAERLGIPLETVVAARRLGSDYRTAAGEIRARLAGEWRELAGLLTRELPDRAALQHRVRVIGGLETELRGKTLEAAMEIRALLTPAQRDQLAAIRAWRAAPRQPAPD